MQKRDYPKPVLGSVFLSACLVFSSYIWTQTEGLYVFRQISRCCAILLSGNTGILSSRKQSKIHYKEIKQSLNMHIPGAREAEWNMIVMGFLAHVLSVIEGHGPLVQVLC